MYPIATLPPTPLVAQQNPRLTEAQNLNQKGADYLARGKAEQALAAWRQAYKIYADLKDEAGTIGTQINQAQALQSLGYYRQALVLLKSTHVMLQKFPNSTLKAQGFLSLGNTLRSLRVLNAKAAKAAGLDFGAIEILTTALQIAKSLPDKALADRINLSIANTWLLLGNREGDAAAKYQEIQNTTTVPILKVQSHINAYRLETGTADSRQTLDSIVELRKTLDGIAPSRQTIYAYVSFAKAIQKRQAEGFTDAKLLTQVSALLTTAIGQAKTIQDARGQAQAIGALGNLYQFTGQNSAAQKLTEQAVVIAESLPAPDLAYRLQWQLGKILTINSPRNFDRAIAAYQQAVYHLKTLRNDLNGSDVELQFSFRDSVEPVYRELVNLLLKESDTISDAKLKAARDLMESLQLAELENYLRQGCLDTYKVSLDQIDRSATIIYPIVLPDRLAVISSIPGQPLRYHSRPIPKTDLEDTVEELRNQMTNAEFSADREQRFKQNSQRIYNLLIAPLLADLKKFETKTLVFVLDGELRNIPMAILYDGQNYLVENYNLALTPGLQLVPAQPKSQGQYQAFLGGISQARPDYSALPGVEKELAAIGNLLPNQKLLNGQFNQSQAAKQLTNDDAPIVHFATHGAFSSNPEETFLLAWDGRFNLNQLNGLLQNRNSQSGKGIDLLVLSACETASGDRRATLGLAGMAIRARTRSTIASLWTVNDRSTELLMTSFYQNLVTQKLGKGESLKLAQQSLLHNPKYRSPFYWAPFVLVGNWQ
jgi:CHAT domain-containing protein